MKWSLYPHGGSGNHGCEAIVRSTAKLLGNDLTLFSSRVEEDMAVGLQTLCRLDVAEKPIQTKSLLYVKAMMKNKFLGQKGAYDELVFRHIVKAAKQSDYLLSIFYWISICIYTG